MKPENEAIRDLATLMFHLQLGYLETTEDLRKRTLLVMEMKSVQQKLVKQILAELTNLEIETEHLTKAVNSFRSSSGIIEILKNYSTLKQEMQIWYDSPLFVFYNIFNIELYYSLTFHKFSYFLGLHKISQFKGVKLYRPGGSKETIRLRRKIIL